ncbi:hypothetical protein EYC80_007724 [Monilinia laxa]|uniref:Uncharacterized protein n=1 Tax=Monilinia laxa TaxID=61186 RepID=A0A5N6JWU0_MONLA|nr:hypothetical protein EYC80_007724 [Monilinia laxa]
MPSLVRDIVHIIIFFSAIYNGIRFHLSHHRLVTLNSLPRIISHHHIKSSQLSARFTTKSKRGYQSNLKFSRWEKHLIPSHPNSFPQLHHLSHIYIARYMYMYSIKNAIGRSVVHLPAPAQESCRAVERWPLRLPPVCAWDYGECIVFARHAIDLVTIGVHVDVGIDINTNN